MMPRSDMAANAAIARQAKDKLPADHMKKKAAERKKKMGPISRDTVYSRDKIMELAGWGDSNWNKAVATGLRHTRHGGVTYVTGDAYYGWIESRSVQVEQPSGK